MWVCLCVYSVQGKCIVGAEMPACPEVLRPKASKVGGKQTPAQGTWSPSSLRGLAGGFREFYLSAIDPSFSVTECWL